VLSVDVVIEPVGTTVDVDTVIGGVATVDTVLTTAATVDAVVMFGAVVDVVVPVHDMSGAVYGSIVASSKRSTATITAMFTAAAGIVGTIAATSNRQTGAITATSTAQPVTGILAATANQQTADISGLFTAPGMVGGIIAGDANPATAAIDATFTAAPAVTGTITGSANRPIGELNAIFAAAGNVAGSIDAASNQATAAIDATFTTAPAVTGDIAASSNRPTGDLNAIFAAAGDFAGAIDASSNRATATIDATFTTAPANTGTITATANPATAVIDATFTAAAAVTGTMTTSSNPATAVIDATFTTAPAVTGDVTASSNRPTAVVNATFGIIGTVTASSNPATAVIAATFNVIGTLPAAAANRATAVIDATFNVIGTITASSKQATAVINGTVPSAAGVAEFVAVGTKTAADATPNSIDVAHPAGTAAGQILVAGRCTWRSSAECDPADETGWTNAGELAGGTGTAADAHTTIIRADTRELSGALAGPTAFDQTGTPSTTGGAIAVIGSYQKYSGSWATATATGDGATHAANRSVTASSTIAFEPGDVLVAFAAVDTDTSLAAFSAPALTASGITFSTTTRRTSGAGITTGNDGNIEMFDATVTAGTATVAPNLAFTTSTAQCGPVVFVRLRGGPAVAPSAPTLSASPGNTEVILTWIAGLSGGSAVTGYLVETSADGSTGWSTVTTTGAVLTYTDTGLTNGTIRYYRVSAINTIGTSAVSNVASATPAVPALSLVQTNTARAGSVAFASPITAGNTLIVTYSTFNSTPPIATPTDTRGHTWTPAQAEQAGLNQTSQRTWFTRVTSGGTCTVSCASGSGTDRTITVSEWAGAVVSPLDVTNAVGPTSGTAASAGAVTPTVQPALVYAAVIHDGANPTIAIDTADAFTQLAEWEDGTSGMVVNVQYKIVTSTATITPNWTIGATVNWAGQVAVFKGA
jgi:hypothetical protein